MTTKTNKDGITKTERWDKFRAQGALGWRTVSLFADVIQRSDPSQMPDAPFWLERNKLGDERPCFRDHFLHYGDPTGNKVALKFLGSQEHWDLMMNKSPWFKEAIDRWKHELEVKTTAEALSRITEIMKDAETKDATALACAKFLVDQNQKKTPAKPGTINTRGRPSKAEVTGEKKRMAQLASETEEDYLRISRGLDIN